MPLCDYDSYDDDDDIVLPTRTLVNPRLGYNSIAIVSASASVIVTTPTSLLDSKIDTVVLLNFVSRVHRPLILGSWHCEWSGAQEVHTAGRDPARGRGRALDPGHRQHLGHRALHTGRRLRAGLVRGRGGPRAGAGHTTALQPLPPPWVGRTLVRVTVISVVADSRLYTIPRVPISRRASPFILPHLTHFSNPRAFLEDLFPGAPFFFGDVVHNGMQSVWTRLVDDMSLSLPLSFCHCHAARVYCMCCRYASLDIKTPRDEPSAPAMLSTVGWTEQLVSHPQWRGTMCHAALPVAGTVVTCRAPLPPSLPAAPLLPPGSPSWAAL